MQNIFPNSNLQLGFTGNIPAYGGSDPMEQIISRYQNLNPPQQNTQPPRSSNRISQVADKLGQQKPQKNTVIKDDMTPFQKQSLSLRSQGLDNTKTNQEANRALAGQRINIADFKAKNPNKRFIAVKGGNIMAFNPQTGDAEDTGINSGNLTDAERLEITQDNTEKNETTRQTNRLEVTNTQHGNRMTEKQYDKDNPDDEWSNPVQTFNPDGSAGLLIQVNKKDGQTRRVQTPGVTRTNSPGTPSPLQPSQEINARKLRISEVLNQHPEWKRFIDSETGQVADIGTGTSILNPGSNDLTKEIRDQIVGAIEGSTKPTTTPTNTPPLNEGNANVLPPIEQRKVGQIYTLKNGTKATWNGRAFNPVQ